jgi:HPt (histidine-containing phosphotransfer) domain-containing protein
MVDISFLESFTKGDKNKMRRYIQMYLDNSPSIFEKMNSALESENWESLKINAHSLKPQVDYMGIPELKKCLSSIEEEIDKKKFKNLRSHYNKACELHIESTGFLEKYVEGL